MRVVSRTFIGPTDAAAGVHLVAAAEACWLVYTALPDNVVHLQRLGCDGQPDGEPQELPLGEATGVVRCAGRMVVAGLRDGAGFWLRLRITACEPEAGELGTTQLGPVVICVEGEPQLLWIPNAASPELFVARLAGRQLSQPCRIPLNHGTTSALTAVAHARGVLAARLAAPANRLELLELYEGNIERRVLVEATATPQRPWLTGYGKRFLLWWTARGGLYLQHFGADLVPRAGPRVVIASQGHQRVRGGWPLPGPASDIALVFELVSPERQTYRRTSRHLPPVGKPAHLERFVALVADDRVGAPQRLDIGAPRAGVWTGKGLLLAHGASSLELALLEFDEEGA